MSVTLAELRAWFDELNATEDSEVWIDDDGLSFCVDIPGDDSIHAWEIGGEQRPQWEDE